MSKEECNDCPFQILSTGGCTKRAHGLKCIYPEPPTTEQEEEAFRKLSADATGKASRPSVLARQEGGTHYKNLGAYQPWLVLRASLTPEEFKGYMKGTALVYLLRDGAKAGTDDLAKGSHTLEAYLELCKAD